MKPKFAQVAYIFKQRVFKRVYNEVEIIIQMRLRRQQIKNVYRKEQLQKQFNERRRLLMGAIEQQHDKDDPSNHFERIIDNITLNIHKQNVEASMRYFDDLVQLVNNCPDASTLVFIHSSKVSQLIELVFRNELIEQNNCSYHLLSPQKELQMTDILLTILNSVKYSSINQQTFFSILKAFWLILQLKNINIQANEGLHLLDKTLQVVIKMMSPPNEIVYSKLKQLGIGSKIIELIQDKRIVEKDIFCKLLSELISLYLQHENMFQQQKNCSIGGVQILGMQSNEKQQLLAFSLALLNSHDEGILESSLTAITSIIERFEYFAYSITDKALGRVCELMDSTSRKIEKRAMQAIDLIIHENDEVLDKLLANMQMPNLILKLLQRELLYNDELTKLIVERCAVILSNITLVKNLKTKKKLFEHPVWEFLYEYIRIDSCLFPMVAVFTYFFEIVPRKNLLQYIQPYLVKISELQLSFVDQRFIRQIKTTIVRLFYLFTEHFPENMAEAYINLLYSNKLNELVSEEIQSYRSDLM